MKGGHVAFVLLLLLTAVNGDAGREFTGHSSKLSGIIIPGFASTQLRAWSILDCPYSPLDFNPLDLVWIDTTKLLSAVNCWLKCMSLEPYNQTDHPECKSRPDSGLSAITELDPGYITGISRCFLFPALRKYVFHQLPFPAVYAQLQDASALTGWRLDACYIPTVTINMPPFQSDD